MTPTDRLRLSLAWAVVVMWVALTVLGAFDPMIHVSPGLDGLVFAVATWLFAPYIPTRRRKDGNGA